MERYRSGHNGLVSKTNGANNSRGFESPSLRHKRCNFNVIFLFFHLLINLCNSCFWVIFLVLLSHFLKIRCNYLAKFSHFIFLYFSCSHIAPTLLPKLNLRLKTRRFFIRFRHMNRKLYETEII